jgi:hypothetical protein
MVLAATAAGFRLRLGGGVALYASDGTRLVLPTDVG